jgi:hypothetical protein
MLSRFRRWLSERRMERIQRMSPEWVERKLEDTRGAAVAARINAGPPLPPEYEEYAIRLTALGPEALGVHRAEVRRIGEELDQAGGKRLMVDVIHRAESLSLQSRRGSVLRDIEMAWDGIGSWQG